MSEHNCWKWSQCVNTQALCMLLAEFHCIISSSSSWNCSIVTCLMPCPGWCQLISVFSCSPPSMLRLCATAKEYNGREERATQESETPLSGRPALLLSDPWEAVFCPGLRQRWRGMGRKHHMNTTGIFIRSQTVSKTTATGNFSSVAYKWSDYQGKKCGTKTWVCVSAMSDVGMTNQNAGRWMWGCRNGFKWTKRLETPERSHTKISNKHAL